MCANPLPLLRRAVRGASTRPPPAIRGPACSRSRARQAVPVVATTARGKLLTGPDIAHDLGVAERHRRRGIATQLIESLRSAAKDGVAHVMGVQADRGDDAAIRLYEFLWTREDVHDFDIAVD